MSVLLRKFAVAALLMLSLAGLEHYGRALEPAVLQEKVQRAIERVEPSVVCILVSRSDAYQQFPGAGPADEGAGKLGRFHSTATAFGFPKDDPERKLILSLDLSHADHVPESYGSGVVLDESGLILTAGHVVRNATKVFVRVPGGRGSWADIHALDPRSDLAVVRLLDPPAGLKPIVLGDGGTVRKGSFVVSVANPFAAGFRDGSPSASFGIISNIRRRAAGSPSETDRSRQVLHQFSTLLQTDVRLNHGCSGGALVNLEGEIIGLTTAMAAIGGGETPAGFAMPLDTNLRRIVEILRRGEEVEYGFLGVKPIEETQAGAGVRIENVVHGSPAERAGLRPGDTILAINGVPVRDTDDLFLQVGIHLAGTPVRLEVVRDRNGQRATLTAKLAKFYVPTPVIASIRPFPRGGLRVDYTSVLAQLLVVRNWPRIPDGVMIREVIPQSAADLAQLQPGKVITHVNNHRAQSPEEYYKAINSATNPVELTILNSDGGKEERLPLVIK